MEYIIDPAALEQDVNALTQPRFLRRAVSAVKTPGGMLTQAVQPGQATTLPNAIASYRDRANQLYQQGSDLYNSEPDVSQLQEFARRRGEDAGRSTLNALAAQFAGEQFQPVQTHLLKKAAAAQEPMKIGGGMLTPEGQYIKDPFAAQDKKAEFLLQQARMYEQMAATAQTAQERAQAEAAQREVLNEMRRQGLLIQQDNLNFRRQAHSDRAASNAAGTFTQSGYTPEGKQLVTNKTGMNFVLEAGPNGQPVYTPYTGAAVPKTTWDKNVGVVQEAIGSANRADDIIRQVEANPDAFGVKAAAVSRLPGFVQGRVGSMLLNENTLKLRSDVLRQAAMEISSLYGAALSMGEQARASTFIPDAADPPDVVINKLRAARDWARSTASNYGGGVLNAATARSGGQPPAAPSASGGLSADEAAELERLRQKHRR